MLNNEKEKHTVRWTGVKLIRKSLYLFLVYSVQWQMKLGITRTLFELFSPLHYTLVTLQFSRNYCFRTVFVCLKYFFFFKKGGGEGNPSQKSRESVDGNESLQQHSFSAVKFTGTSCDTWLSMYTRKPEGKNPISSTQHKYEEIEQQDHDDRVRGNYDISGGNLESWLKCVGSSKIDIIRFLTIPDLIS